MKTIYVYVMDTMADWEAGNVMAELNSKRFFKAGAPELILKTVGATKDTIKTMGGLTVMPDCALDEIEISKDNMLILPGSDAWADPKNFAIVGKAKEFLDAGADVCAICGATVALASASILDNVKHTSNGVGFLDMFCPNYKGKEFYVDEAAVMATAPNNAHLFTASATGGLLWAKLIIEHLGVFAPDTLTAWYEYFSTGKAEAFFALMNAVQASRA